MIFEQYSKHPYGSVIYVSEDVFCKLMETPLGVKIVHLPTGYVVECDDFRSQHKNKEVCIEALKELLNEFKEII